MSYKSQWYVKDRVAYIYQYGVLSLEDAVGTDRELARMAESVQSNPDRLMHGIIDSRAVTEHSLTAHELQQAFLKLPKPTDGWVVTVPGSALHAFMTQFMATTQGMKQRDFRTPEDALAFLIERDHTLTDLPVNPLDGGNDSR